MPKQIHKIDQFHGGLNTNSDPRDIADNELSTALGVMVDELGTIRMLGGDAEHASETGAAGAHACAISNGYGLFAWNHDRIDGHTVSAGSDDDETGENYLALSDADTTGKVHIYADSDDTWGTPITGFGDNTAGTRKDVFYSVDGALRVCDSEFGNTNTSKWYGYIDKVFMASLSGNEVTVDQWTSESQYISMPTANSAFDQSIAASVVTAGDAEPRTSGEVDAADTNSGVTSTGGTQAYFESDAVWAAAGVANIYKLTVEVKIIYTDVNDAAWAYTLTGGDATNSTTYAGSSDTNYKTTVSVGMGDAEGGATVIEEHVFTFADPPTNTPLTSGGTTAGVRVDLSSTVLGGEVSSISIDTVTVQEGTISGSAHTGASGSALGSSDIFGEFNFSAPATGTAIGWDRKWEHGFSLIYDGKQESLIRRVKDVTTTSTDTDGSTLNYTFEQDNTSQPTYCPNTRISVNYSSSWGPRITGAVWYIRDSSGDVPSKWWGQVEYDFVAGESKVLSTGKKFNATYNSATSEINFDVDQEYLLQPNQVDTYRSRTGISEDTESLTSRFSSAVQVGRRVYIGNVQIINDDGTKEVKADAMIKSPVNRFDTFPSSSIVEAAINDGESIIALEEFADRILQFKEQTLYIINVSQDIEFLEDVHKYKGVSQPSAVCKTDYGIAWVNKFGCYLYDGKQVINLLEKGGRQIIRDHGSSGRFSWETFSTYNPMIGYLPHKRQLLVVDDNTVAGSGNIMLYDMVTQSWVRGNSSITSNVLTNFVNDWDGNLVWAHTSGSATMRMWDDDSAGQSNFAIYTKDIDFGEPGRNKKLYKVLVTYDTGNATSNVHAKYIADGLSGAVDFAADSNANFTTPPELDSANGWEIAELKPGTSSEANNKKSFKLIFITDGTVPSGFKINDISYIYRMKNIK